MRLIDADALKICMQDHYGVIEQDCSISEEFADGAISGIDAAMFEVDVAPTIDAIPVEWLEEQADYARSEWDYDTCEGIRIVLKAWQKEQEAR